MGFLVNGLTNKEIAARMGITVNTVKVNLVNIYIKLDSVNRVDAAIKWLRLYDSKCVI